MAEVFHIRLKANHFDMKNQNIFLGIGILTLIIFRGRISREARKLTGKAMKVTKDNKRRGCDPLGCGYFGASRGQRKHVGTDILAFPGEHIFSPVTGKINRIGYPYATSLHYKLVEIVENSTGNYYRIMYVNPSPNIKAGAPVQAGDKIGEAQDISRMHGAAMLNHVHVDARPTFDRSNFINLENKLA